ncbi:10806_t:CDS:2 [Cetraspora pellucida]|uniref:10806_t:CDS:1 n=1 Tax=Cetraspora pellucida TaxID=1433469 RepID=A0ACA9KFE6_9GLOM|nr:10806_t:CDS:2 [Cetraspora pellucida]
MVIPCVAKYYCRFVKRVNKIAGPVTNFIKKNNLFYCEEKERKAFNILKRITEAEIGCLYLNL